MSSATYCCFSICFTVFLALFGWAISIETDPTKAAVLGGGFALCVLCLGVVVRTAYHDEKVLLDLIDSKEEKEA